MKVGWVSALDYDFKGGAEAADLAMMAACPAELELIRPDHILDRLDGVDRVVVSSLRGLLGEHQVALARWRPAIWVHDTQFHGHWLYQTADPLIALTPQHLAVETRQATPIRTAVNPGHFDTTGMYAEEKSPYALWAHRTVWHKGLDRATEWSARKRIPLRVVRNQTRDHVIAAMRVARYFVLLSHVFDPGPWAVIEAQLCGCELVVDNIGYFDEPPERLRERIEGAAQEFWKDVLG